MATTDQTTRRVLPYGETENLEGNIVLQNKVDDAVIEYLNQGLSLPEAQEKAYADVLEKTSFRLPEIYATPSGAHVRESGPTKPFDPMTEVPYEELKYISTPGEKRITYNPYKAAHLDYVWKNGGYYNGKYIHPSRYANLGNEVAAVVAAPIIALNPVTGALANAAWDGAAAVGETVKWGLTTPAGQALTKKFIGDALIGTAGYMGVDALSTAVTGKTVGQNIADAMGYIPGLRKIPYQYREYLGNMANPGAYWGAFPRMASSSAAMNLNPVNNTVKSGLNNIKNRAIETALRVGDDLSEKPVKTLSKQLFGNKAAGLRYIFGGNGNLAYRLPYKYDGMKQASTTAHRGDLIDVLMSKSNKLLSNDGNVLGELTHDLSNVPESTIKAFQTLPGRSGKQPQVLKIKYPADQFFADQRLDALIHNSTSTPTQIFRWQASEIPVKFKGPYETFPVKGAFYNLKDGVYPDYIEMFASDPGHYGVTGVYTPNGLKAFGHDVYHFSPKLFSKTNGAHIIFKPLNFTAGNPFIAEWEINPLIPKYDFYRRFRFNQPVDLSNWTGQPYLNTLHQYQSQVSIPFKAGISHKHGGRLNKK